MLTNQTDYTRDEFGLWSSPESEVSFFEVGEGFGYITDGHRQPHDPDLPGQVEMSWDRAVEAASALLQRLKPE